MCISVSALVCISSLEVLIRSDSPSELPLCSTAAHKGLSATAESGSGSVVCFGTIITIIKIIIIIKARH